MKALTAFSLFLFCLHAVADTAEYDYTVAVNFSNAILQLKDEQTEQIMAQYEVVLPRSTPKLPVKGEVVRVEEGAWWYPTERIRAGYKKRTGRTLPRAIPPGDPLNAMGAGKIYIHYTTAHASNLWRIHGEDEEEKLGQRLSLGCVRLYDPDWVALAHTIKGKRARVVFHQ